MSNLAGNMLGRAAAVAGAVVSHSLGPRLSVLIFHRVLPQTDALFPTQVDAVRFDAMMGAVARAFKVMPLGVAAQHLAQGSLPHRALAITFDDGYADNEEIALPILQRHGLHATFFVSTGFLDGGRMWNDTVIECIRNTAVDRLDLNELGLGCLSCISVSDRQMAIKRVITAIKHKDLRTRDQLVLALGKACGQPRLSQTLMMTRAQVKSLHEAGMEIGAHTVNHPILCSLPDAEARQELRHGRDELQTITGAAVRTLAYPNGRPDEDYDLRHTAIAKELGFDLAVTTAAGVSSAGDDLYQLPRFTPWDAALPRWLARLSLNVKNARFKVATHHGHMPATESSAAPAPKSLA